MATLPLTISHAPLTGAPDSDPARLEVSFLCSDDTATALLASVRGRAARQTAQALGMKIVGEAGAVHVLGGLPLEATVGLGPRQEVTVEALRRAAAHAVGSATDLRRTTLVLRLPGASRLPRGLSQTAGVEALAESVLLTAHARQRRRTVSAKPDDTSPPTQALLRSALPEATAQASFNRARHVAEAVALARELGDTPANRMSPQQLAKDAAEAGRGCGLTVEVLDVAALEKLGAGLLLAVGSGSSRPPAMGVLRYQPRGRQAARHVAVIGKGITFDAGGLSIKPAKGMGDMVHDKAGAAAAAAIAVGAALLDLPVAVTAVLACAENLPSGAAYRPGDVLSSLNGSTVEVIDTDAEGRLVLADALAYAVRQQEPRPADVLIDLATLTGSIVSALGNEAAGLFSNNEQLAQQMLAASEQAGEPLWRMPILAGHRAQLKSERADRKQCADRWGDCAIAAAFLECYVDKRPWLHLDIAGVAYNEGSPEWPPYHPKSGAAGAGVRTVLRFLESLDLR